MALEAAGINAMQPLIAAADTGLSVVDCDGMGRALPGKATEIFPETLPVSDRSFLVSQLFRTSNVFLLHLRTCTMPNSAGGFAGKFSRRDVSE